MHLSVPLEEEDGGPENGFVPQSASEYQETISSWKVNKSKRNVKVTNNYFQLFSYLTPLRSG